MPEAAPLHAAVNLETVLFFVGTLNQPQVDRQAQLDIEGQGVAIGLEPSLGMRSAFLERGATVVHAHGAVVFVAAGMLRRLKRVAVPVVHGDPVADTDADFLKAAAIGQLDQCLLPGQNLGFGIVRVENAGALRLDDQAAIQSVPLAGVGIKVVMEEHRAEFLVTPPAIDHLLAVGGRAHVVPAGAGAIGDDGIELDQMDMQPALRRRLAIDLNGIAWGDVVVEIHPLQLAQGGLRNWRAIRVAGGPQGFAKADGVFEGEVQHVALMGAEEQWLGGLGVGVARLAAVGQVIEMAVGIVPAVTVVVDETTGDSDVMLHLAGLASLDKFRIGAVAAGIDPEGAVFGVREVGEQFAGPRVGVHGRRFQMCGRPIVKLGRHGASLIRPGRHR